jgi:predicted phage gp36 major capsid-like protein
MSAFPVPVSAGQTDIFIMTKYAEKIAAYEAKRAALQGSMGAIMDSADSKGETLDAAQQEEFDDFGEQIKAVDAQLERYRTLEGLEISLDEKKLTPIIGVEREADGSDRRGSIVSVKSQPKLAPGIEFARLVKCFGMAKGNMGEAVHFAKTRYGEESNAYGLLKTQREQGFTSIQKAEVPAGSTVSGNWAEDLVGTTSSAFADFVEFLRPMTILGKFGTGGIPSLRNIPFRVPLISQTAGGDGYWVGEGKAKPLTSFDFSRTTLTPLKVANIVVLTDEVIRDSSPSAEAIVRDQLAEALKARMDIDFINPAKTASAGVSPASITNGAAHSAASGTGDADDVRADIRSLLNEYVNGNNPATSAVLIMRTETALAVSMMVNALGQTEFNGISMAGGTLLGIPVITSNHVPSGVVAIVNASDIYFADEGGIRIDMSREATVEMLDSSLTGDSIAVVPGTAASTVSLWQTNSVGFLAERTVNWARRQTPSVAYLTGVAWGGAVNDLS